MEISIHKRKKRKKEEERKNILKKRSKHLPPRTHTHLLPPPASTALDMKGCGAGGIVVAFSEVGGEAARGRCKIYLLLSENFDPRVVNLSEESSQPNRKRRE